MDLIGVLLILLISIIILNIFAFIFKVGIFAIVLPFKLLAIGLASIFVFLILIPLGIIAGIAGLIILPLALISPLLPFILLGIGIWVLLKKRMRIILP